MVKQFLFGSMEASDSAPRSLNVLDLKKTARGLVVTIAGAALVAGFDFLSSWILNTDFGQYQLLVGFVISSGVIEIARRWVSGFVTDLSK